MRPPRTPLLSQVLVFLAMFLAALTAAAEHRATHLGNPATRFAPPLSTVEDVRALFRNPALRPDIEAILRQADWKGKLEDLLNAAASEPISEIQYPHGTRFPFMSTRRNGRPVVLQDVVWVGKKPVDAFVFVFLSNGHRYRCVIPKPCSNFLVVDLGRVVPKIELVKGLTAEVGICDPLEVRFLVRNTGPVLLTDVRISDTLPAGIETTNHQPSLSVEVGSLRPGEVREHKIPLLALTAGTRVNSARVTSAEGAHDEAKARTIVRAPVLGLDCSAPGRVNLGQPAEVCLTLRNDGDEPDSMVTVILPIPPGATMSTVSDNGTASDGRVVWQVPLLLAQEKRKLCATFVLPQPGELAFAAEAGGVCAPPVRSTCLTRVSGVAGVLLELVDVEDPVEVGHEVNYDIRVTNQGSAPLTNLRMVCQIPEVQEFVSASGITPARTEARTITMETLPSLGSQETATWRVIVKATSAAIARFEAHLSTDQLSAPSREDESTNQY